MIPEQPAAGSVPTDGRKTGTIKKCVELKRVCLQAKKGYKTQNPGSIDCISMS